MQEFGGNKFQTVEERSLSGLEEDEERKRGNEREIAWQQEEISQGVFFGLFLSDLQPFLSKVNEVSGWNHFENVRHSFFPKPFL